MRVRIVAMGAWLAVLAAAFGCGGSVPDRTMDIEFEGKQGLWRLEGVQAATLDMDHWKASVTDTVISEVKGIPHLRQFTLTIINTSGTRKLYIEPREIFIRGIESRMVWLGPAEPVVLAPGARTSLDYDEEATLLYPFAITVTVFRGPEAAEPHMVVLHLQ